MTSQKRHAASVRYCWTPVRHRSISPIRCRPRDYVLGLLDHLANRVRKTGDNPRSLG